MYPKPQTNKSWSCSCAVREVLKLPDNLHIGKKVSFFFLCGGSCGASTSGRLEFICLLERMAITCVYFRNMASGFCEEPRIIPINSWVTANIRSFANVCNRCFSLRSNFVSRKFSSNFGSRKFGNGRNWTFRSVVAQIRKQAKKYRFSVGQDFDAVVAGCIEQHGETFDSFSSIQFWSTQNYAFSNQKNVGGKARVRSGDSGMARCTLSVLQLFLIRYRAHLGTHSKLLWCLGQKKCMRKKRGSIFFSWLPQGLPVEAARWGGYIRRSVEPLRGSTDCRTRRKARAVFMTGGGVGRAGGMLRSEKCFFGIFNHFLRKFQDN